MRAACRGRSRNVFVTLVQFAGNGAEVPSGQFAGFPGAGTRNTIFMAPKLVPLAFNVKRVTIGIPRPSPEEHS